MARLTSLFLLFSLSLSTLTGCSAVTRRHRGAAAAVDATAALGAALVLPNAGCENEPGLIGALEDQCRDEDRDVFVGTLLLGMATIAGVMIIADEVGHKAEETPEPVAQAWKPGGSIDEVTLRLARQAYRQSEARDCNAARATLAALARQNPPYYAALVASPAVAGCR